MYIHISKWHNEYLKERDKKKRASEGRCLIDRERQMVKERDRKKEKERKKERTPLACASCQMR